MRLVACQERLGVDGEIWLTAFVHSPCTHGIVGQEAELLQEDRASPLTHLVIHNHTHNGARGFVLLYTQIQEGWP
jgi:hypothetical protein